METLTLPLPAQTNAPNENTANQSVAAAVNTQASNSIAATASNYGNTGVPIGSQNPAGNKSLGLGIRISGTSDKYEAQDIVAIVAVFSMPVAIVAIVCYTAHRRNKLVYENLRAMIDKGIPITPELVGSLRSKHSSISFNQPLSTGGHPPTKSGRSRRLLPGLILIGAGAALMINGHYFGNPGLIVFFIGIAFLIVWLVERIDRNNSQSPKP
jgi:hypothetical protein